MSGESQPLADGGLATHSALRDETRALWRDAARKLERFRGALPWYGTRCADLTSFPRWGDFV